jgi:phenylalanyl-tRNA synthetase beta chain
VDFYEQKNALNTLFKRLDLLVTWDQPTQPFDPWFHPYETAQLTLENELLGFAGKVNPRFMNPLIPGDAFVFELNIELLLKSTPLPHHFIALSKYQSVTFDISILVPLATTVADLENAIIGADSRICDIQLIDFFDKEEWIDKKSLTFRITIVDPYKTMTQLEIEAVRNGIMSLLVETWEAHIR